MTDEQQPSIHDSLLTAYEVDGRARTIVMHTEPHRGGGEAFVDVRFEGVEAYAFENDLLQNIVFDIAEADAAEYASIVSTITGAGGRHGFPREWDSRNETVEQFLARQKLTLFVLSASYGMTGWVAATSMTRVVRARHRTPENREA
jgi:hypothetical protein